MTTPTIQCSRCSHKSWWIPQYKSKTNSTLRKCTQYKDGIPASVAKGNFDCPKFNPMEEGVA